MPDALPITKAYLRPISWDEDSGEAQEVGGDGEKLFVQFNPQSLKVTYANQKEGDGQPGSAPIQYVGKGTTKLAVDLLFDTTVQESDSGQKYKDVRVLTQRVATYLEPQETSKKGQFVPPGVRFGWGPFVFDGVVDSMDETLDYFGEDGTPLRATVALQISKQEITIDVPAGSPGTVEQHQVENGETFQQAAAEAGRDDWQDAAAANGVENPRQLAPGSLMDMGAGLSAGVSGGLSAGISGGFSAGISGGFSAGVSGGFSAGVSGGFSAGVSAGLSGGISGGIGGSAGLSIGAANTLSLGVASGLGYGASSRTSLTAGVAAGAAFGAGLSGSAGASAFAGASASGSASAFAGASASASGGASAGITTHIR